ncbi:hypothetical protein SHIRM173S_10024 [Streptomyces hirsutus]
MARPPGAVHAMTHDRASSLLPPAARHRRVSPMTGTPGKEIAHLLANLPMSLVGFTYVVTVLFLGLGLTVTVVGVARSSRPV